MTEKNDILPIVESESLEKKYLIGQEGLVELERVKDSKKIKLNIHTCGNEEFAFPWRPRNENKSKGIFIALGKEIRNVVVKWLPAKEVTIPPKPSCLSYKKSYIQTSASFVQINGLDKTIFFTHFDSPEQVKFLKELREYEKRKKPNEPYPKVDCSKADVAFQKIGFLNNDKCEILLESEIDCEGQGYEKGQFGEPLGLIEISIGNENEKWLIFHAHGYEGDAYLGIKMSSDLPVKKTNVDFYVYSGC